MNKCYSFYGPIGSQWVPCPSGLGCCVTGDICLSNNICQYGQMPTGSGNWSGYYAAACTDSTFKAPACPQTCTNWGQPDIVYNYTSSQWNCCDTGPNALVICNHPRSVIFPAPAPERLTKIQAGDSSSSSNAPSIVTSASSTSATGQISTFYPTSSPTQNSNSNSTNNPSSAAQPALSKGIQVVIGILASFTILFIVALLAGGIYYLHRRGFLRSKRLGQLYPGSSVHQAKNSFLGSGRTPLVCEKCKHGMIHEMNGNSNFRPEMCGNSVIRHELDHTSEHHPLNR